MLKEALQYIQSLKEAPPYRENIHGVEWTDRKLNLVTKPLPPPVNLESLTSFVAFVNELGPIEGFIPENSYILVDDYNKVSLVQEPTSTGERRLIVEARQKNNKPFPVGTPMGIDAFIIALKGGAVPSPTVENLITQVSAISLENIATLKDNGVYQEVAIKQGINVSLWNTPPFFNLILRRTFPEVDDVESEFFLRLKAQGENSIQITLHEATFEIWRSRAMEAIRKHILTKTKALVL